MKLSVPIRHLVCFGRFGMQLVFEVRVWPQTWLKFILFTIRCAWERVWISPIFKKYKRLPRVSILPTECLQSSTVDGLVVPAYPGVSSSDAIDEGLVKEYGFRANLLRGRFEIGLPFLSVGSWFGNKVDRIGLPNLSTVDSEVNTNSSEESGFLGNLWRGRFFGQIVLAFLSVTGDNVLP